MHTYESKDDCIWESVSDHGYRQLPDGVIRNPTKGTLVYHSPLNHAPSEYSEDDGVGPAYTFERAFSKMYSGVQVGYEHAHNKWGSARTGVIVVFNPPGVVSDDQAGSE